MPANGASTADPPPHQTIMHKIMASHGTQSRVMRWLCEGMQHGYGGETMEQIGWIGAIIIGGLAGWFAEMFMKSNQGVLMNILLGIVGAALANVLLGLVGVILTGWLGYLIAGFIGACILIAIGRMLRSS